MMTPHRRSFTMRINAFEYVFPLSFSLEKHGLRIILVASWNTHVFLGKQRRQYIEIAIKSSIQRYCMPMEFWRCRYLSCVKRCDLFQSCLLLFYHLGIRMLPMSQSSEMIAKRLCSDMYRPENPFHEFIIGTIITWRGKVVLQDVTENPYSISHHELRCLWEYMKDRYDKGRATKRKWEEELAAIKAKV